jgi:guanylate kinase
MLSGTLYLIVGPSGVGKGTAINLLKIRHKNWQFPITATTRSPRPGEEHGTDYFFLSQAEFDAKIAEDEFLEWANVHGETKYGLLKDAVLPYLTDNKTVVRELDYQGCRSVKALLGDDCKTIFLLPPSRNILIERIIKRAPMSEEELQKRTKSMDKELAYAENCDCAIQTTDGDPCITVEKIEAVIKNAAAYEHQKC